MKRKQIAFALLGALLVIFLSSDVDAQCAMCKKNLETNLQLGKGVGRNINKGILYLMAVPYLAIGFIFRKQLISFFKQFLPK